MMKLRHAKVASVKRDVADTKSALCLLKSNVFSQKLKSVQKKSLASLLTGKSCPRVALYRWHYQTLGLVIQAIRQDCELQVERAQQVADTLQEDRQTKRASLKLIEKALVKSGSSTCSNPLSSTGCQSSSAPSSSASCSQSCSGETSTS